MTKKKKPGSSKNINETRLSVNFEKTTKARKITEEEKRSALHDLGEREKSLIVFMAFQNLLNGLISPWKKYIKGQLI